MQILRVIGTGSDKTDDEHDYTTNICRVYHGKVFALILPYNSEVVITAKTSDFEAKLVIK